jgi:hypothetical protein
MYVLYTIMSNYFRYIDIYPELLHNFKVQRFLDQIHTDTVALSGIQFFYLKRGLVLTVRYKYSDIRIISIQSHRPHSSTLFRSIYIYIISIPFRIIESD